MHVSSIQVWISKLLLHCFNIIIIYIYFKGYTSLQIAAIYDHTDVMSILMEYGADPNVPYKVCK